MDFDKQRCGMKQDCQKLSADFKLISSALSEKESEIEQLKSKLKVALEALSDIFNKAKDGSHCEQLAREALKEIES